MVSDCLLLIRNHLISCINLRLSLICLEIGLKRIEWLQRISNRSGISSLIFLCVSSVWSSHTVISCCLWFGFVFCLGPGRRRRSLLSRVQSWNRLRFHSCWTLVEIIARLDLVYHLDRLVCVGFVLDLLAERNQSFFRNYIWKFIESFFYSEVTDLCLRVT